MISPRQKNPWPAHPRFAEVLGNTRPPVTDSPSNCWSCVARAGGGPGDSGEPLRARLHSSFCGSTITRWRIRWPAPPLPIGTLRHQSPLRRRGVTVLLQDTVAGLQVLRDDNWFDVLPVPDTSLSISATCCRSGRTTATARRCTGCGPAAVPRAQRRLFLQPGLRHRGGALGPTVSASCPARYRPLHWGEFRRLRAGDYGDYGEEIQISRYRSWRAAMGLCPQSKPQQSSPRTNLSALPV